MCSAFAKEFGKKGRKSTERTSHTKLLCNLLLTKNPREFNFPNILTQILLA